MHDHHSHGPDGHAHGPDPHGHAAGHVHAPADFGRAFAVGIALNTGFVLVEAGFGLLGNSVALLADAGHNLSDVLGLVVAWVAVILSRRIPSGRFTYGLRGSSVLAALFNAVFLLVAVGAIAWESVLRMLHPQPVGGALVIAVALVGIAINGVTAWLFASGRKGDLNIRGAYLHMAADAAVSAGVVAAGLGIAFTGWLWLDPLASLVIVAVIVWSTWGLLRDSVLMSLSAAPPGIDPADVKGMIGREPGVSDVHDLHVWAVGTSDIALTAHLVMPDGHPGDPFLLRLAAKLRERFGIGHATIQVETDGAHCPLAPEHAL